MKIKKELKERLSKVKFLILDVDGIMSDGGIYLGSGMEYKRFDVQDGSGIKYLQRNGIQIVIISGRESESVKMRAEELGIKECHQKALKKLPVLESIISQYELQKEEICVMGDDLPDLPLLKYAGVFISVPNAAPEVKENAHYITQGMGGHGAVREAAELILKAQDKWESLVKNYLK